MLGAARVERAEDADRRSCPRRTPRRWPSTWPNPTCRPARSSRRRTGTRPCSRRPCSPLLQHVPDRLDHLGRLERAKHPAAAGRSAIVNWPDPSGSSQFARLSGAAASPPPLVSDAVEVSPPASLLLLSSSLPPQPAATSTASSKRASSHPARLVFNACTLLLLLRFGPPPGDPHWGGVVPPVSRADNPSRPPLPGGGVTEHTLRTP